MDGRTSGMFPASTRKESKKYLYHRYTKPPEREEACASQPLRAGTIDGFVIKGIHEAAAVTALAADMEQRLRGRCGPRVPSSGGSSHHPSRSRRYYGCRSPAPFVETRLEDVQAA